jgi:hypothetical protein
MPDELDALRQFRDETPGPSTDAWNRARAAIAAARAEEEPAGRGPGRRSPRRQPGQRRVLWMVTVGAVAAAVAGLLAVLLPGSLATRGTRAQFETTAFVTRVEHALSESSQRQLVGYARTMFPPGYTLEPVSPGGIRVGSGASSPWTVGYLVRLSYRDTNKVSAFTAAGYRVFDLRMTPEGGMVTSTGVFYRSRTWWRGVAGPSAAVNGPAPTPCGPGVELGPGGWPSFLRHELGCGEFTKGGQQRIGRVEAVELTGNGGHEVFWVNPATYLPVRAITTLSGSRQQTDFGWFAPTKARLAGLRLSVPPGFRQVPAPPEHPSAR